MFVRSLLLGFSLLASCAGPHPSLVVKQFKMLDTKIDQTIDPMIRGEKQRRLHGAISMAERRERLGIYYTLLWEDPDGVGNGDVEVVFEYQQGATASKVKRMSKQFAATGSSGRVELAVIGSDYLQNGRVLAWQATLTRGGRVLATQRSYLWRTPSEPF